MVTSASSGQTSFIVQDSSSPAQTATVQVTSSATGILTADFDNPLVLQNIYASVGDIANPTATNIIMQGGIAPYSIATQPDSTVALAFIPDDRTLSIVGVAPGITSIMVQDSSSPSQAIALKITVGNESFLSAVPQNISTATSTTAISTISGGTAPYDIATQPDSGIALALVSGNTLSITGIKSGTTSVVVEDSFSPSQTITIPITISNAPTIDFNNPTAQNISIKTGEVINMTMNGLSDTVFPSILLPSNSTIATAQISGTNLVITGVTPGTTSVIVQQDLSFGKTVVVNITVQ
jgi:hypothetical protein